MKFAAWSSLIIGILMLAQWTVFLSTGQVPEVRTAPIALTFHLVAEGLTAALLIVAAVGLLRRASWSRALGLVANGMLIYTVVVSPGYFAQNGDWPLVGMFAVLLAVACVSIVQLSRASVRSAS